MRKAAFAIAAAIFAVCVSTSTAKAEDIDNPEYKSWSGFKVGSWVTMKMVTEASGMKTEMEQTHKLVELTKDKAVIETSGKMVVSGNPIDLPATKREIPAKVAKPAGGDGGGKKADVKESDEEVEVGGKKVKAHKVETHSESGGTKSHTTIWNSNDIPGHIAKMESKSEGASASHMTMVASKWEAAK